MLAQTAPLSYVKPDGAKANTMIYQRLHQTQPALNQTQRSNSVTDSVNAPLPAIEWQYLAACWAAAFVHLALVGRGSWASGLCAATSPVQSLGEEDSVPRGVFRAVVAGSIYRWLRLCISIVPDVWAPAKDAGFIGRRMDVLEPCDAIPFGCQVWEFVVFAECPGIKACLAWSGGSRPV